MKAPDRHPAERISSEQRPDRPVGEEQLHPGTAVVHTRAHQHVLGGRGVVRPPRVRELVDRLGHGRRPDGPPQDLVAHAEEQRPAAAGQGAGQGPSRERHDAHGAACGDHRAEQAVLRLRRVGEPHRLCREEEGEVEGGRRGRQRGQAVGVRDQGCALGLALGHHRHAGRHERDDEHDRQPGRQAARAPAPGRFPAGAGTGLGQLGLGAGTRGVEEPPLHGGHVRVCAGGPVERGGEPGAPVQLVVRPAGRLPVEGSRGHVPADRPSGSVVLQPPREPWPLGEERLVGHLEQLAVHRQQPAADERVDHGPAMVAAV
ncbi:hypothetical protein U6N30_24360 [Blastococcus brunescens]|uniref:Uncharacterized protein n=1 Tax=Blastococcus brunescens TaxID=1564165 RepID=A0ABZ1AYF1_9ACTN|nr:hypothetical protein [Blastococcus sp. BMG 8361]WRL62961.1 hypothetical protein U6N30_24360 [Blastococcus sp. BMG 8361]